MDENVGRAFVSIPPEKHKPFSPVLLKYRDRVTSLDHNDRGRRHGRSENKKTRIHRVNQGFSIVGSTVNRSNQSSPFMSTASSKTMHPSNKSLLSCTVPASSQNRNLARWYLNKKDELSDRKSVPLNILRAKFLESWFWAVEVAQQSYLLAKLSRIALIEISRMAFSSQLEDHARSTRLIRFSINVSFSMITSKSGGSIKYMSRIA